MTPWDFTPENLEATCYGGESERSGLAIEHSHYVSRVYKTPKVTNAFLLVYSRVKQTPYLWDLDEDAEGSVSSPVDGDKELTVKTAGPAEEVDGGFIDRLIDCLFDGLIEGVVGVTNEGANFGRHYVVNIWQCSTHASAEYPNIKIKTKITSVPSSSSQVTLFSPSMSSPFV